VSAATIRDATDSHRKAGTRTLRPAEPVRVNVGALRHAPPAPAGYDAPLSQVLLVAALGSGALAIAVAIARATVGDAVVAPVVAASVRGASYLGLVLAAGGLAFTALVWPEGRGERRLASIVWLGWLTVGAATVLHLASHDAAGTVAPDDRIAAALGVRLALLLGAVVWVSAYLRRRPAPRPVGLALFAALACTWVYAGPVAPGPVTIVMTLLHLAAACVWAGGLAVLAAVLLPWGSTASLEGALRRFSPVATVCVGVLAVSGIYHARTRAGSVGSLFSTPYGYAFWLKVLAVSAMLVVANANRKYVARHVRADIRRGHGGDRGDRADPAGAPDDEHRDDDHPRNRAAPLQMLGLFLGAEIAFGLLVMVLTGVLVDAPVSG
jgi:putative copper export protein